MNKLNKQVITHWKQLRGMTYDFLDVISGSQINKKLPFKKSQTLGYQFSCMLGTIESYDNYIKTGKWTSWDCSLENFNNPKKKDVITKMKKADKKLTKTLTKTNLTKAGGDYESALGRYMILVEHESHHQGQIINYIYALNLPIPKSWAEKWALKP